MMKFVLVLLFSKLAIIFPLELKTVDSLKYEQIFCFCNIILAPEEGRITLFCFLRCLDYSSQQILPFVKFNVFILFKSY